MDFRQFGGTKKSATTFQDSFQRADQPFYVGDSWAITPLPGTGATGFSPNFASGINVAGNQLNLTTCSTNGQNQTMLWPIPINWAVVFAPAKGQYSQAKLSADNSGGVSFAFNGPAVLMNVNKNTGYFIWTNGWQGVNSVGNYGVVSLNGSGANTNLNNNGGVGFPFAVGDVLRIEAYVNLPAAGSTTVKTYRNGVLQSTTVDAVNAYKTGVMGINDNFVSAGVTQSWQNFDGGAL